MTRGYLAVILLVTAPGIAMAEERKGLTPEEQFNQGVDLAAQKKYDEAVSLWTGLLDQLPEQFLPNAHQALGLAYMRLALFPEAWHHLTLYGKLSGRDDSAVMLVDLETKLETGHVLVNLTCPSDTARIEFPGVGAAGRGRLYPCPLTWWFTPGQHTVKVRAAGGMKWSRVVKVERPVDGASAPSIALKPESESQVLEWSLIGGGAAVAAVGVVLGVLAESRNNDLHERYKDPTAYPDGDAAKGLYDSAYDDEVRPKRISSYVCYGVGGAVLATGIALMFLHSAPSDQAGFSPSFTFVPIVHPDTAGAFLQFTF